MAWEGGVGTAAGYKLQVAVPLAPRHDDRRGSRNFAPFAMIRVQKIAFEVTGWERADFGFSTLKRLSFLWPLVVGQK